MKLTAVVFLIVATILCPLAASAQEGQAPGFSLADLIIIDMTIDPQPLKLVGSRGTAQGFEQPSTWKAKAFRISSGVYVGFAIANLLNTDKALRTGQFSEANPLMAWLTKPGEGINTKLYVFKIGSTIAVVALFEWAWRSVRDSSGGQWAIMIAQMSAAALEGYVYNRDLTFVFRKGF